MPNLILNIPGDDGRWQPISVAQDELKRVGRGAVSDVYVYSATDGRRYAIKIFNSADAPWEKLEILRKKYAETTQSAIQLADWATSSHGTERHAIAWPISIVYTDHFTPFGDSGDSLSANKRLGFVLPFLDPSEWLTLDHWIEHHLLKKLGNARVNDSLSYRLLILKNCAAALAELHSVAMAMVDVKPANIRVEKKSGRICLLDVDSYRVSENGKVYPATHVSSGYIWPAAQAHVIDVASLDQRQDCYAYAVLVFRVLNYGIHPFQSKPRDTAENSGDESSTVDAKAKAYLYAYGNTEPLLSIKPLPQSVHECWPTQLRDLLSGAFTKDGHVTPMEKWESYFKPLLDSHHPTLARCSRFPEDLRHIHFDGYPCMACARIRAVDELKEASSLQPTPLPSKPELVEIASGRSGLKIAMVTLACLAIILVGFFFLQGGTQKPVDSRVQNPSLASGPPQSTPNDKKITKKKRPTEPPPKPLLSQLQPLKRYACTRLIRRWAIGIPLQNGNSTSAMQEQEASPSMDAVARSD